MQVPLAGHPPTAQLVVVLTAGVLHEDEAFVVPATGVAGLVQAVQVPLPLLSEVSATGLPLEVVQADQVEAVLVPLTGVVVTVVTMVVVVETVWQTGVPGIV